MRKNELLRNVPGNPFTETKVWMLIVLPENNLTICGEKI